MTKLNTNMDQAQKLIRSGNFRHAADLLATMPEDLKHDPQHSTMLGWALFNSGEHNRGIEILSATTRKHPHFFDAHQLRGTILNHCGELEQSLECFRQAEKLQPSNAMVKLNIGATCIGLGKTKEALEAFSQAVTLAPDNADAHGSLANVLAELGRYEDADRSYQRALELSPAHVHNLINYAIVLQGLDRHDDALDLFERAEQHYASSPPLYKGECRSLLAINEVDAALQIYQQASNLFPQSSELMEDYCYALAEYRSIDQALERCDRYIATQGADIRMLAARCILLNEAGDIEQLRQIADFDSRLGHYQLTAPDDTMSRDGFLKQLADSILDHPTLTPSPRSHATQSGSHTGELFTGDEYVFNCLKSQLHAAVDTYIEEKTCADDIFSRLMPKKIRIRGWSVVMNDRGYQLSHTHPSAWLSGVCYLQLPDIIESCNDQQGWLEFGSYPPYFNGHASPQTRLIKPEVGSLIVFPSYFWHKTVPFHSRQKRISLAFDVIAD